MPEEALPLPAITVADLLVLPRIPRPIPGMSIARPVARVITITAHRRLEGAGIQVRRPFPGPMSMADADPFLLLDHAGPTVSAPEETSGRTVAPAPGVRDRHVRPGRRDLPPRHQRRRRGDRRG
jgi:hypothetical protein